MKMIVLDGAKMTDKNEAHQYLKTTLSLPDYYGKNLDALYDCLTEDFSERTIVWYNADKMVQSLGDYGKKLMDVVEDAAVDNEHLMVYVDGE